MILSNNIYLDQSALHEGIKGEPQNEERVLNCLDGLSIFFHPSVSGLLGVALLAIVSEQQVRSVSVAAGVHPVVLSNCTSIGERLKIEVKSFGSAYDRLSTMDWLKHYECERSTVLVVPSCHWLTGEVLSPEAACKLSDLQCVVILDSAQLFGTVVHTKDLIRRPRVHLELFSVSKHTGLSRPLSFCLANAIDQSPLLWNILSLLDLFGGMIPRTGALVPFLKNTRDSHFAKEVFEMFEAAADQEVVVRERNVMKLNEEVIRNSFRFANGYFVGEPADIPLRNHAVVSYVVPLNIGRNIVGALEASGITMSFFEHCPGEGEMCLRASCPKKPISIAGRKALSKIFECVRSGAD